MMGKVDTQPKGLLVPAWSESRHRLSATVVIGSGPLAGLTLTEAARKLGLQLERVRYAALKGQCPTTLKPTPKRGEALRRAKL